MAALGGRLPAAPSVSPAAHAGHSRRRGRVYLVLAVQPPDLSQCSLEPPAEIVEQYIDQKNRSATAVIIPDVKFVEPAVNVATTIARHVVPLSVEDEAYMPYGTARSISMFPPNLETEADFVRALRNAASNSRFRTLVFTDRLATSPSHR